MRFSLTMAALNLIIKPFLTPAMLELVKRNGSGASGAGFPGGSRCASASCSFPVQRRHSQRAPFEKVLAASQSASLILQGWVQPDWWGRRHGRTPGPASRGVRVPPSVKIDRDKRQPWLCYRAHACHHSAVAAANRSYVRPVTVWPDAGTLAALRRTPPVPTEHRPR